MLEVEGDLFYYSMIENHKVAAICITTNGVVNYTTGNLVMGAGIAKHATEFIPQLPRIFGIYVSKLGNQVQLIPEVNFPMEVRGFNIRKLNPIIFPTKIHWKDNSDIKLIERSCQQLLKIVKDAGDYFGNFKEGNINYLDQLKITLPRPGCGNGGLNWRDVKPVLERYFDDQFIVVHNDNPEKLFRKKFANWREWV